MAYTSSNLSNEACVQCVVFLMVGAFMTGIIWGSIEASIFVERRKVQNTYTKTICLLLNYTLVQHSCRSCDKSCRSSDPLCCNYYDCFDEELRFSYPVSDETRVNSTLSCVNQAKVHQQTQVILLFTVLIIAFSSLLFSFRLVIITLVTMRKSESI